MNSRTLVLWKKTPSRAGSAASGTMAHRNTSLRAHTDSSRKYAAIGAYHMTPHNRMASSTTKARSQADEIPVCQDVAEQRVVKLQPEEREQDELRHGRQQRPRRWVPR